MRRKLALFIILAGAAGPAAAYIGPGAGISFLGSVGVLLWGIVLAILAILFWPIRALIRKARGGKPGPAGESETASSDAPADRAE